MSILYASLLAAVAFALLIDLVSHVRRASQPLVWASIGRSFAVDAGQDRRTNPLPFVGKDRREAEAGDAALVATALGPVVRAEPLRRAA